MILGLVIGVRDALLFVHLYILDSACLGCLIMLSWVLGVVGCGLLLDFGVFAELAILCFGF